MTRIDFYVLSHSLHAQRVDYACRIAEKALRQKCTVVIATENMASSNEIDQRLWSQKPESFIPHRIIESLEDTKPEKNSVTLSSPILIDHNELKHEHCDVMINLSQKLPQNFSRFKRMIEIVIQAKDVLSITRKNHHFYKQRGYPLNVHKF